MLVSSMVTVLGLAFVIGILSHSFQRQLMNELKKEAVFISRGVEAAGTDYLDQLSNTDSRITYVDESGKVLYDNEADVENMENHGHRKEIREAELNGEGEDERMSSTLSEKTMYYALRLDNGNVLRVSSTQKSAFALVWQLVPPLLGVLFLILVLSAVFASRLSGRVVEPLNNLDLEHPEEINVYEEVEPLISKIYRQNRQIRLQLEAARRQQKEFSIITENMQEGLLVIDRYTMVLSGNSSVGKLLKVNEIRTGESVYLLNRSEDFRGVVEQVLEGNHEDKILRLDGSDIQVIANPVTRENKTEGAVILLVDVTEKVEREQLRREFSANVSHELKTPLTSISGFAEIMQDGFVKDEDVKVFAGRIYKEAQRLIRLVGSDPGSGRDPNVILHIQNDSLRQLISCHSIGFQIMCHVHKHFINRIYMNIFRRHIFQIYIIDPRTVFHIKCHPRRCRNVRQFRLTGFSAAVYLFYFLNHFKKPGPSRNPIFFQGWRNCQADGFFRAAFIRHHQIGGQRIKSTLHTFYGCIK